jgi:hypothetical protein
MKMYYKKPIISLFLLSLLLMGVSCKNLLDINHSPNVPTFDQGTAQLVFPAAVLATTGKVGGDLTILGSIYAENCAQAASSNQYKYIDAYDVKSTDFNASYDILFSNGLKNYRYVIDKARANGDWTFYLMGTVMNAYTTAILVDLYDKIPYFEAMQGLGNLSPKFDDGFVIYKSLLDSIDFALGKDFTTLANSIPGDAPLFKNGTPGFATSDLVFQGDLAQWKAFANTLKLKLYLRMVNAQPALAQTGVTSIINSGVPLLTSNAGVFNGGTLTEPIVHFSDVLGKDNPFYEQNIRGLNTTDNIRASKTFASWLISNSDPRAVFYFGAAAPVSINQGDYNNADPALNYNNAKVFVQSPVDPVFFISQSESYFLQAEAMVRYYGAAGAQALYDQGVMSAFAATGNDGSSFIAGAYAFPTAGTTEEMIEAIVVQKWASFPYGCHAIEGWFERNRTGYPKSSPVYSTVLGYVPGQFVISANSVLPAGQYPKRLVYPYDETSRNSNAPALVSATTAVWWGK